MKDIYDTAGVLTSGHSRICIDRVPSPGCDGRRQAARGRRRADGQARHARVRTRRTVLRPALAAGAQSLEHGAFHRRLLLGLGRRARHRPRAGELSAPTPAARSAARRACAASPVLNPPMASSAARACCPTPTPTIIAAHGPHRAGLRADPKRDRGPRSCRPSLLAAAGRRLHGRARSRRQRLAHRRDPALLGKGPTGPRRAAARAGSGDCALPRVGAIVEDVTLRPLTSIPTSRS